MTDYMKVAKKTVAVVLAIQATLLAEAAAVYVANACYEAYLEEKANTEVYNVDQNTLKTKLGVAAVKACGDIYNNVENRLDQVAITACQQAVVDAESYLNKAFAENREVSYKELDANATNILKNTVDDRTKHTVKYMGHSINPFAHIGAAAVKEYYAQGYMHGLDIMKQINNQIEAHKG